MTQRLAYVPRGRIESMFWVRPTRAKTLRKENSWDLNTTQPGSLLVPPDSPQNCSSHGHSEAVDFQSMTGNAESSYTADANARILVTGGSGLLGRALQWAVNESEWTIKDHRFGGKTGEEWIFLTSADGDLRYDLFITSGERFHAKS